MKAVICPICGGTGTYYAFPNADGRPPFYCSPCHGCGGKGWVEVSDEPTTWVVDPTMWTGSGVKSL